MAKKWRPPSRVIYDVSYYPGRGFVVTKTTKTEVFASPDISSASAFATKARTKERG